MIDVAIDVEYGTPFFPCVTFHPPADAKTGVSFQCTAITLCLPSPAQEGKRETERKGSSLLEGKAMKLRHIRVFLGEVSDMLIHVHVYPRN